MATLRGSKSSGLEAIAETLELALKSAKDEKQLRGYVKVVIKTCRNLANGIKTKK